MNLFNLIFFILYSAPKKSCLKKGDSYTKKGLNVHFKDLSLVEVKIFKSTDEPNAPNITQEEYMKIQEEVRNNPEKHKTKIEEINNFFEFFSFVEKNINYYLKTKCWF